MQNRILFFIIVLIILFFALTPENMIDKKIFSHSDKIKHILAFFTLSIFIDFNKKKTIKIIILILFAMIIELLQSIVGRQASLIDFLFSCAGIFLYLFSIKLFKNS